MREEEAIREKKETRIERVKDKQKWKEGRKEGRKDGWKEK